MLFIYLFIADNILNRVPNSAKSGFSNALQQLTLSKSSNQTIQTRENEYMKIHTFELRKKE